MVFIFLPKGSLILNENRKLVSPATIALACLTERDLSDSIALHPIVWPLNTAKGGAETIPYSYSTSKHGWKIRLIIFPSDFHQTFFCMALCNHLGANNNTNSRCSFNTSCKSFFKIHFRIICGNPFLFKGEMKANHYHKLNLTENKNI